MLLHALGEGRSDWAPVVNRFAEHFRVVTVDLRGHGDSDWPGTYSFQSMADDVLRLLDHLGLIHVRLLGHSMGGCIAYLIAEQSPGRVELLVVEDAPPPFVRERPVPERPEGELDFDWAVVPAIVGEVSSGNQTMWDRLSSITAPTLLVGGGPESHIPQEKLREVAERIRTVRLSRSPLAISCTRHALQTSPMRSSAGSTGHRCPEEPHSACRPTIGEGCQWHPSS